MIRHHHAFYVYYFYELDAFRFYAHARVTIKDWTGSYQARDWLRKKCFAAEI